MSNIYYKSTKMMTKSMQSMINILEKTKDFVSTSGMSEQEILASKLHPTMFDFKKQIQLVSDNAKGISSRFVGLEIPSFEDNEMTLDDLINRLKKTIDFVNSISKEQFENAKEQKIVLPYFGEKFQEAEDYLLDYAVPNFYFHLVTAYGILRHIGMEVGKGDYVGSLNLQDL
jgi:hypothetical protein